MLVIILVSLWIGGTISLAILAYMDEDERSGVMNILRLWWETRGYGYSVVKRFTVSVLCWILYPAILLIALFFTVSEKRKKGVL